MHDQRPTTLDAGEEYRGRLARHEAAEGREGRRAERLVVLRLGTFFVAVLLAGAAALAGTPWTLLLLPGLAFPVLVHLHGQALRRGADARRLAAVSARGLARIEDRWQGGGAAGERWRPERHLYADDLDLFGRGSLFELLSTARTHAGERRLAEWLLAPADRETAGRRQEAVAELRPRVDLREDLAIAGSEVSAALDRDAAAAWGALPPRLGGRLVPWVFAALALASVAVVVLVVLGRLDLSTLLLWGVVLLLANVPLGRRVAAVLEEAERPAVDLDLLGRLVERLESEAFQSAALAGARAALAADGERPSARIRRLGRLMAFVDARRNQVFLPISGLLGLGTQLAYAIERWRAENGPRIRGWVEALADVEALLSLSAYAYERPEDPFPDLVEGPAFAAEGLGHPLIPRARCVVNDVALGGGEGRPQALVVSGSNMSGKSTLLRSVGVAVVLARAGAPVRARALQLGALRVGASIRVLDSLGEGTSRFYAEIERLRAIVDLAAGPDPALFLLDEILGGTNSHDRRIGAAAVIRSLLDRGALGLVTTHDLALTEIATEDLRLRNVHFEDHLEDGRMAFDYRMRDGVVRKSNAIGLMRAVGLPV
jgi:hypothetical protein